ncbi:MAG: hypothetical protein DMG60_07375 [Acidobacteria bacterium]|nr:MAG: hypothetical protein DMG60_07375 [Acidobacteriota bacterium]
MREMLRILGSCQGIRLQSCSKHAQNPSALPKACVAAKRSARREQFFSSGATTFGLRFGLRHGGMETATDFRHD